MKAMLSSIIWANNKAKRLAIRLRGGIHPKHLMPDTDYWYGPYISPDDLVLDVGCGMGAHSVRVASWGNTVHGIDRMVPALSARRVTYEPVDLERQLPIFGKLFDVALCLDVLEHIQNRVQLLRGIRRALKPGGMLLLSVPQVDTSKKQRLEMAGLPMYSDTDHKTEYTLASLTAELRAGGFSIDCRYPGVYDTQLTGIIDVLGSCSLTFYRWATKRRRRLAARYPWEDAGFYLVCARD